MASSFPEQKTETKMIDEILTRALCAPDSNLQQLQTIYKNRCLLGGVNHTRYTWNPHVDTYFYLWRTRDTKTKSMFCILVEIRTEMPCIRRF
jgi:hypothetical protein